MIMANSGHLIFKDSMGEKVTVLNTCVSDTVPGSLYTASNFSPTT